MANLAKLSTGRLLSRKGTARPTASAGTQPRSRSSHGLVWHPAAIRRMDLQKPEPRVRVSIRLHPETHRELKGYGAITHRTQQSILVQALEEYLDRHNWTTSYCNGGRRNPASR